VVEAPNDIGMGDPTTELFSSWSERVSDYQERHYRLAGHSVSIRYSSEVLLDRLGRALSHLQSDEPEHKELTILAWDGGRQPLLRYRDQTPVGPPTISGSPRFRAMVMPGDDILSAIDISQGAGFYWTPDAANLPYWESGSPFRQIFHWWCNSIGLQQMHAAGVGNDLGGVLVVGKGGAGKSTIALSCLCDGMLYLGDDYTVGGVGPPEIFSLYSSAKLHFDQLATFPTLRELVWNADTDEKALLFAGKEFGDRIVDRLPLRAIIVPSAQPGGKSPIQPISSSEALRALAPSTIGQLPGSQGDTFRALAEVTTSVPAFRLSVWDKTSLIPSLVANVLAGA
jgi:hypothetical protein